MSLENRVVHLIGGDPVQDIEAVISIESLEKAIGKKVNRIKGGILIPANAYFELDTGDNCYYFAPSSAGIEVIDGVSYSLIEFGAKKQQLEGLVMLSMSREEVDKQIRQQLRNIPNGDGCGYESSVPICIRIGQDSVDGKPKSVLGGNNYNLVHAMAAILGSNEIQRYAGKLKDIEFNHFMFLDYGSFLGNMIKREYEKLGVNIGVVGMEDSSNEFNISGLKQRQSVSLTLKDSNGVIDRSIFTTLINDESLIKTAKVWSNIASLSRSVKPNDIVVVNTITHIGVMAALENFLEAVYSQNPYSVVLSPSGSFLSTADRLVEKKGGPYADGVSRIVYSILKSSGTLILNLQELLNLFPKYQGSHMGTDNVIREARRAVGTGKISPMVPRGVIIATNSSRGATLARGVGGAELNQYSGLLSGLRYPISMISAAEILYKTGDDVVGKHKQQDGSYLEVITTKGAGDIFVGVYIALSMLGWRRSHALRGATLGAQYFMLKGDYPNLLSLQEMSDAHSYAATDGCFRKFLVLHILGKAKECLEGTRVRSHLILQDTLEHHSMKYIIDNYLKAYKSGTANDTVFALRNPQS